MRIMPTWLTAPEAMKHLKISRATFYKLVREKKIIAYYIEGVSDPRYLQGELDAMLKPKGETPRVED